MQPIVFAWWDFSAGDPERAHPRPRPARAARHAAQPADAGGARLALDRRGDELAASAPALCRDPFPRGRPLRLRLGDRFRGDDPRRHGVGRLWRAAALRRRAGHRAVLCPAAGRRRDCAAGLSCLDLHLSDLRQPPARQCRRGVSRAAGRMGRLSVECRRITRNTAPRPTTRIPTAAASAIRASAGRC